MKTELEDQIVGILPEHFPNFRGAPSQTCLAYGFSCGDGWAPILLDLVTSIAAYEIGKGVVEPTCVFDQVKEKFGILTIYARTEDPYVRGLIDAARSLSARTCENCGSTKGIVRTQGWISTLCRDCLSEGAEFTEVDHVTQALASVERCREVHGSRRWGSVLWLDDVRDPSNFGHPGAVWVRNVDDALNLLTSQKWDLVSLDHDLGEGHDRDGWVVAKALVEMALDKKITFGTALQCHSANPPGRSNIEGYFKDVRDILLGNR